MITKINKIQEFRVFQNFVWPRDLGSFKKYNVIFGWNGSGKTTFSDLLRQIELKKCFPECMNFEIVTESGKINRENIQHNTVLIKVYNQNFREENISFDTGEASPIFFLGVDSIGKKDELNKEKFELTRKNADFDIYKTTLQKKEKEREEFCTKEAGVIKELLRSKGNQKYNNYHKGNFRKKCQEFQDIDYKSKILKNDDLNIQKEVISSDVKPSLHKIVFDVNKYEILDNKVKKALKETIISDTIERLKRDSELNSWVREGFEIIKRRESDFCPFCEQKYSKGLLEKLEKHFNEKYDESVGIIEKLQDETKLLSEKLQLSCPKQVELYPELIAEYENHLKELAPKMNSLSEYFSTLSQLLSRKKKNPFEKLELYDEIQTIEIQKILERINSIIKQHNEKTINYNTAIEAARKTIEEHFVAKKVEEFIRLTKQISSSNKSIELLTKEILLSEEKIENLEANLKEHRRPADQINADLRRYLRRDEIQFSVKENGYQITRDGKVAQALSEGEKTAITFIYFLKTLEEDKFKLEEGVVVIDDPISSLDSNALYYAFQYMKDRTKKCAQLFVLTHSYNFFKEIKNWYSRIDQRSRAGAEQCFYYMLKNSYNNEKRVAHLECLDELLRDFDSEYHFLFSLVYNNSKNDVESLKNSYLFPNVSRRLLEIFLAFRIPSEKNLSRRMKNVEFDTARKDRIYRFINDNSHSGHISGDPDRDLSYLAETQMVSKDIMDLIKEVDAPHYEEMIKIVNRS